MAHQEPCETLTLERPPRLSYHLRIMVEGKPINFLLDTGCNTNVEEADVQSADALKPVIEFTWPGTQTTNEISVPVQQEAGLGSQTTTEMGVPTYQAIESPSPGLGTRTTTEMGVPVYQAIESSSPGLGTRSNTEMGVPVYWVRECYSTAKGKYRPEFLQGTVPKAVLNHQDKKSA